MRHAEIKSPIPSQISLMKKLANSDCSTIYTMDNIFKELVRDGIGATK